MAKLPVTDSPQQQTFDDAKPRFEAIPENSLVNCEVEKCEIRELNKDFREKYNIRDTHEVSFQFRVLDGPHKNRKLWGTAKPYLGAPGSGSRLRLWTKEIFAVDDLPDGYEFDTDDVEGLKCRVLVANYTKRDGTKGDRVKDVLRAEQTAYAASGEEPF